MDNYFYETPCQVASLLAKHINSDVKHLLDPSVGTGALIKSALNNNKNINKITAIDVDLEAIKIAQNELDYSDSNIEYVCDDYLTWAKNQLTVAEKFDCIVMNPPFCSKKENYILLEEADNRRVALEVAFLYMSMRLLSENGKLIAILPGSVVSSNGNHWLRSMMLVNGSIKLVHELPKYTFPGVESKIYMLVYENKKTYNKIKFLNHSIRKSATFSIKKSELCNDIRLDYGYIESRGIINNIVSKSNYTWVSLSSVSTLFRGDCFLPDKKNVSLHTTDFFNGFWGSNSQKKKKSDIKYASPGDIIVKRVGRNCLDSVGIFDGEPNTVCSDCIIVIRANNIKNRYLLLFSIRCWVNNITVKKILQKGTGATYVTNADLSSLQIPSNLHKKFPKQYRSYIYALKNKKYETMISIESDISCQIL